MKGNKAVSFKLVSANQAIHLQRPSKFVCDAPAPSFIGIALGWCCLHSEVNFVERRHRRSILVPLGGL
eukprot:scaffold1213_cov208-Alexandrium_tamarense.AAC.16